MRRGRRIFGPLFYVVLTLACTLLVGLKLWDLWPSWQQYWESRALASDLRSPDVLVSWQGADQLAKAGSAGVPWLVDAMRDRDPGVRLLAVSALYRTMPLPKSAILELIDGLRDEDVRIRRLSADALGRIGPEAVSATDGLTGALSDPDPIVRFRAARALIRVEGQASESARRALLAMLAEPVINQIPSLIVVAPVIRRLGPEAEAEIVAALVPLIDAKNPLIRRTAIAYLEELAPQSGAANPALNRSLHDADLMSRCLAALALSEIEGWQSGRARAMLQELEDHRSIPSAMQKQVHWVLTTNLVAGSEISQPVHTLRFVVDELRRAEGQFKPGAVPRLGTWEDLPGTSFPSAWSYQRSGRYPRRAWEGGQAHAAKEVRGPRGTSAPASAIPPRSTPSAHIRGPAAPR
jgi:hypothetical protein